MKIKKMETITTEKEIEIPYYSKSEYQKYFKIFGDKILQTLMVDNAENTFGIENTSSANAVGNDMTIITETEFNNQYLEVLSRIAKTMAK
jgi:hypothetical protein